MQGRKVLSTNTHLHTWEMGRIFLRFPAYSFKYSILSPQPYKCCKSEWKNYTIGLFFSLVNSLFSAQYVLHVHTFKISCYAPHNYGVESGFERGNIGVVWVLLLLQQPCFYKYLNYKVLICWKHSLFQLWQRLIDKSKCYPPFGWKYVFILNI